jgi:hypothetical protein
LLRQTVKYWEIIAENLSKRGWSWGYVTFIDQPRPGAATPHGGEDFWKAFFWLTTMGAKPSKCAQTDSNQAEDICPARFFAPSGPANHRIDVAGKKGRTMNRLIQSKNTTILPVLIALKLGCFGLSPQARAVSPPPDGGYPNNNTAEGQDALFSLTTGFNNTAVGFDALFSNTGGNANTAVGSGALAANTGSGNTATGTDAMSRNTSGTGNVANGDHALFSNLNGNDNLASGSFALFFNSSGVENTASGFFALEITPPAARIRPSVLLHSSTTPPAAVTLP